jgi:hypothetical protein
MRLKSALAVSAVAMLAACGGGSSAISNDPTTTDRIQTLKSYSNGSGAFSFQSPNLNVAVFSTDTEKHKADLLSGVRSSTPVPGSSFSSGSLYEVSSTGVFRNGRSSDSTARRIYLSPTSLDHVEIVTSRIGSDTSNWTSSGTPVNGLPTGSFNYNGITFVTDALGSSRGQFTLSADFNNNTGSISGSSAVGHFFSSENLQISRANGEFSSSTARIGETGVTSDSATINGFFAGQNAAGVHGVVFTNDTDAASYVGIFAGSRYPW